MKKLLTLFTLLLCVCSGAWGETIIKTIDFSQPEWSGISFSQTGSTDPETYNGVTFNSKHDTRHFSIDKGVLTFPNNNPGSGNYMLGFPVTGIVGGSITIKVYNGTSTTQFRYTVKDGGTSFKASDGGSGTQTVTGTPSIVKVSGLSNSVAYIYIGRGSSSYDKITKIEVITPELTDISSNKFYPLYDTSSSNYSALIEGASFPSYISFYSAGSSDVDSNSGCSSTVTTPYNFSTLASGTTYKRLKTGNGDKLYIDAVSHVKSIRLYGNGNGSTRNVTTAVTKVSGTGSAFTISTMGMANSSKTVVEFSTGDLTKKVGYDRDTYYTYTISFPGACDIWGIYVEYAEPATTYNVTYKINNGSSIADVEHNVAKVEGDIFTWEGHTFTGWNTQADGKGTDYAVGNEVETDLTLFAQWLTDNDATFGDGAYIIESSALDLSTLFTSSSDGTVTYTVTDANGTGASIEGTSFTATTAGTATVKASQSATSTYTAKELTATITVATNPLGSHTLTWSIATNTSSLSSTQNSSSLVMLTSNMTEIALEGLTISSGEKPGLSAKIQALASYDAAKYAYIRFTVADGYRFTPSSVTAVVQAVGTDKDQNCKMILSDTKNSIESDVTECPGTKDGSPTDVTISNDGNVSFTGTVTLKIYVYGNDASYRLGPAITISGNVFKVDNVTIAANKEWITYCSTNALDFSKEIEGLESAYTISSHTSGATTLTATPMTGTVKSGTGLLLHAKTVDPTNPQVISIPVVASGDEQTENMLKGVIVDTEITPTDGIYTNLGLKNGTFVPYSAAGTIAANKAYLQIPTSDMPTAGAKLTIVFGEKPSSETDGIKAVSTSVENGIRYNLAGQKVGADYKGIVIVNGKKVIIK